MQDILIVGVGGFVGSTLRLKLGGWILHHSESWRFPLSTFVINILGCLVIGLLAGLDERYQLFNQQTRLLLFAGLLGGFTTFSAFGFETVYLLRMSEWQAAIGNVTLSVVCGIAAVYFGTKIVAQF